MKILLALLLTSYFLLPTSVDAQSVDLLWQGETYTPPFYEGKALWSKQSSITLVAIPTGLGSQASLNYRWTKNGTVLGSISGVGKSSITFTDSILSRPQTVQVDIVSANGALLASASTLVIPISPTLLVYENDPLYGFLFNRAVSGESKLEKREVTFGAFPLFFSANRNNNILNYVWDTNTGAENTTSSVTYRTPDDASGTAQVSVRVRHPNLITQDARTNFKIQFDNRSNRGI